MAITVMADDPGWQVFHTYIRLVVNALRRVGSWLLTLVRGRPLMMTRSVIQAKNALTLRCFEGMHA
jgi:hypothetical protein